MRLSEWLHDAVWKAMGRCIDDVRNVSQRAIFTLQTVAQEMHCTDMPSPDEIDGLLRDVPRFELATLPEDINLSAWAFLGRRFLRYQVKASLQRSIGPLVKRELHLYGQALSQWSQQFVNKIVLLVSSYADTYRVQLHRMAGTSNDAIDVPQLERDLSLLTNWAADDGPGMTETIEREA
jgi:hypothetical protein